MDTLYQILLEAIKLALAGILGGLIGARANDKFARKRDQDAGIMAEKLKFIPLIDGLINLTDKCDGMMGSVRYEVHPRLYEPAMRFGLHLAGERLRSFNEVWGALANTTREEVSNRQPDTNDEQFDKMQKTLKSRLEALREVVHDT